MPGKSYTCLRNVPEKSVWEGFRTPDPKTSAAQILDPKFMNHTGRKRGRLFGEGDK